MPDPTTQDVGAQTPDDALLGGVVEDFVEAARAEGNPDDLLKHLDEKDRLELQSALNNMLKASADQKQSCPIVEADKAFAGRSLWDMVLRARRVYEGFPSVPKAKKEGADVAPLWEPPNIFANFAWSLVETAKTRWNDGLFATRPFFQVRARKPQDQEAARSIENFMDYGHDVVGFQQGARAEVLRAAVDGCCPVYLYWDADPDVSFPNRQIVPFEDFFIDPLAESVQKARFVGRRLQLRWADIKAVPGVDLEGVGGGEMDETSNVSNMSGWIEDLETCDLVEVWFRATSIPTDHDAPDQQIYRAWIKLMGDTASASPEGHLILLKRSDFWLNDYPFYVVNPIPRPGSPFGFSLCDRIAGIAEEMNFLKTSRAISRAYSNCPVLETGADTAYNNDPIPLAMYPGMKIPAGWQVKTFPDVTQNLVNEVKALLEDAQFVTGIHDVLAGRTTTSRQTAREVLVNAEGANMRQTDYAQNIGTAYKEYFEMGVGMVLQWHTRPEDFIISLPNKDDEYETFDRRSVLPSRVREKYFAGVMGGDGKIPEGLEAVGQAIAGRILMDAQQNPLAILTEDVESVIEKEVRNIVKRQFMFKYADPSVRYEKESKLQLLTQIILPMAANNNWNVQGILRRIAYLMGEDPDMLADLLQPNPQQMMLQQMQQMMSGKAPAGMGTPPNPADQDQTQLAQMAQGAGVAY